jgi:hypothetical protein
MPQTIDLADIAGNNPLVDLQSLEKSRKLTQELRGARLPGGLRSKRSHPLIRRRVRIIDDLANDPRLTRLASLKKK